ncbi:MAG: Uma2 family endonuclease [Cyanophyceae cyanobacterium]
MQTAPELTLAPWTVEDYHRMIAAGILDDRAVELLEGQIYAMVPEGPEHAYSEQTLADRFRQLLRDHACIREDKPITLTNIDSEPEPDIAIARGTPLDYLRRHPSAADLLLIVEIANTTLRTDLTRKRDLYARASIPEYWVVDLQNRRLEIFRNPDGTTYRDRQTIAGSDSNSSRETDRAIAPLAFPDIAIALAEILPPPPA